MGSNTVIKQSYRSEYDYHIYKLGIYLSIKKQKNSRKRRIKIV